MINYVSMEIRELKNYVPMEIRELKNYVPMEIRELKNSWNDEVFIPFPWEWVLAFES